MNEKHCYEVDLEWNFERKGTLSSPVLPLKIEVATPPDFPKGMKNIWTPEHLFVASVNSCLMATFLAIAENSAIEFISFESNATGTVGKIEGKLTVIEIVVKPKILIAQAIHEEQILHILELSERQCLISNSIKTKISLIPNISVQQQL